MTVHTKLFVTRDKFNRPFPPCIMYVQYTGECALQRRLFSTSGGYHEYTGGISWWKVIGKTAEFV